MTDTESLHRERLLPSWWVWLILGGLVAMLSVAYGAALGSVVGWILAAILATIGASLLLVTSPTIRVDGSGLQVGRAHLPRWAVANPRVADRAEVRKLRGPGSDARVFTALRPWSSSSAVLIEVADASDPHPAWLVSSRHPEALRSALSATMAS
jgi:hypothetical protein